jgi:hypothetical protein
VTRTTAELRRPTTFHGVPVSTAAWIVFTAAEQAGVDFELNDGRRTIAIQAQRVRDHGVWSPSNPHGAALPNASAPHIKHGRANHAWDVDLFRPRPGGQLRLATFARQHGIPVAFNVSTEAWHEDPTSEVALVAAARRLDDPFAAYPADEARWLREYDSLERDAKRRPGGHASARRVVLRRVLTERRKSIWRAAQDSGWDRLNRRARYASLLARTK